MGFYERESSRETLRGPILERSRKIVDVGAGTGCLPGRLAALNKQPLFIERQLKTR
jgi:hypothetical protein